MAQNKGYLQADRSEASNEQYTPFYAVEPITKYIPKEKDLVSVRLRVVGVLSDV